MLDRTTEPWPPADLRVELLKRRARLIGLRRSSELWIGAREFYRETPVKFINHWAMTYDPRLAGSTTPALTPFILFRRQQEFIEFIYACLKAKASGLVEKSRDMGATWGAVLASIHLWLFWEGAAVGWGSRKAMSVDQIGRPDSIFEKIRIVLRNLPRELLPDGFSFKDHMSLMKIINPQ